MEICVSQGTYNHIGQNQAIGKIIGNDTEDDETSTS